MRNFDILELTQILSFLKMNLELAMAAKRSMYTRKTQLLSVHEHNMIIYINTSLGLEG